MYINTVSPFSLNKRQRTYQLFLVNHENTRVCFEVDPFGLLDDLETGDSDVFLIRKTEANEV